MDTLESIVGKIFYWIDTLFLMFRDYGFYIVVMGLLVAFSKSTKLKVNIGGK